MHAISLEYLRNHLDDAIAMAEVGELIITRDTGCNLVLVSESDWRNLQEITHLLSTPLNTERLQLSIETSRVEVQKNNTSK
jgi:PHD/YefM family antitoxin component YafN of YafNO toxin-antitoxin module